MRVSTAGSNAASVVAGAQASAGRVARAADLALTLTTRRATLARSAAASGTAALPCPRNLRPRRRPCPRPPKRHRLRGHHRRRHRHPELLTSARPHLASSHEPLCSEMWRRLLWVARMLALAVRSSLARISSAHLRTASACSRMVSCVASAAPNRQSHTCREALTRSPRSK